MELDTPVLNADGMLKAAEIEWDHFPMQAQNALTSDSKVPASLMQKLFRMGRFMFKSQLKVTLVSPT